MCRFALLILALFVSDLAHANDYNLIIDGHTFEISLDKRQSIVLADGKRVTVTLSKKPFATFTTEAFNFQYPTQYTPARTNLGEGVHQTMIATPLGTALMVQEYRGINPTQLVDFLLDQIIVDEKAAGYRITKTDVKERTADGKILVGKRAVCTIPGTDLEVSVYAFGRRGVGMSILTMRDNALPDPQGDAMLERFWRTIKISL